MPLLIDKPLATKEDFAEFRDLSANIKDDKLLIFIRESQTVEIRDFIGAPLYTLLQLDYIEGTKSFSQAKFSELWFGKDYPNSQGHTVRFNGLMSALIYWSYTRFLLQQQVNVSRFGVESVQNEISEDVDVAQVRIKGRDSQQMALRFQNDAERFLKTFPAIYPEYIPGNTNPRRTSFEFFKV